MSTRYRRGWVLVLEDPTSPHLCPEVGKVGKVGNRLARRCPKSEVCEVANVAV